MIQYILECITFQLVFLIIYDFWLKRETFFQWNRLYLIGTYILSLVLPWVKVEAFKTTVPEEYFVYPEFLWQFDQAPVELDTTGSTFFHISWQQGVFLGGMLLATLFFGVKLRQLYLLRKKGKVHYFNDFTQIIITNSQMAFSFFRSIFLGDQISDTDREGIVQHELVHIKQRHSWDLLFFELMRIVGWFNPLVYVYQNRISELHEFIADAQVAKTHKKEQYQLLLSQVFQTQHISFINQFFKSSLIKKRIVMLQKSRSKKIFQLKYLLLVPFVLGMLFYSSCEHELGQGEQDIAKLSVADIENLAEEEEQELLGKLLSFSKNEAEWIFILTDNKTSITFSNANQGSYISGPNGELIQAKMVINSQVLDEDFSLFDGKFNELRKLIDEEMVPFGVIDEIPVFPGCEDETDKRACFNESIQKHISKNFRYPLEAQQQGIQGRVNVMFVITKEGSIQGLKMRSPNKLLEDEVARIVSRLPQMSPGKQGGEAVNVPFSIPITFKLEQAGFNQASEQTEYDNVKMTQLAEMPNELRIKFQNAVPFAQVAQSPIFPGCEDASDARACFMEKIQTHIRKNFNYPKEAMENGVQGRVNVMFLISTEGNITSIAKLGPDKLLEDEAVRIISRLPKMQPGKKADGESVNVPFSIPITFKLQ